jgi:IS605 OrfB family transposase
MLSRTLSSQYNFNKTELKILNHLAKISKKIYNCSIFCYDIFDIYKRYAYQNILDIITDQLTYNKETDKYNPIDLDLNDIFLQLLDYYYKYHIKIKDQYINHKKNITRQIDYEFRTQNIQIHNDNFQWIQFYFINKLTNHFNVNVNDYYYTIFIDIIEDCIKSKYMKAYRYIQHLIKENRQLPEPVNVHLLDNVRRNQDLFNRKNIVTHLDLIVTLKKDKVIKFNAQLTHIESFILRHIGENKTIHCDLKGKIIQQVLGAMESYKAKRMKGMKANKPLFKKSTDLNILPFYIRPRDIGKDTIRLCLGKYISKNYSNIVKQPNLICLKAQAIYKKYVYPSSLEDYDKNVNKSDYLIINNGHTKKMIDKNSKYIIESRYMYIPLPKVIKNYKIKMVNIIPRYNGHRFDINYIYDKPINNIQQNNNDNIMIPTVSNLVPINDEVNNSNIHEIPSDTNFISIDTGINNLLTIYDPSGDQIIISGKQLKRTNEYYNKKISNIKSYIKQRYGKDTSKSIRRLLTKRKNYINNFFNQIVNYVFKKYQDKTIIIGLNKGWKQNVNMGRRMNRIFYYIPYSNLILKLQSKFEEIGSNIIVREENHTSICDALAREPICHHDQYLGERIERGLFRSSTGRLINADINGAMNIMRKHFIENYKVDIAIIQHNIFNPKKIKVMNQ